MEYFLFLSTKMHVDEEDDDFPNLTVGITSGPYIKSETVKRYVESFRNVLQNREVWVI